jgi:uncharacterized hydrophobic protein (TIGR00271 family)
VPVEGDENTDIAATPPEPNDRIRPRSEITEEEANRRLFVRLPRRLRESILEAVENGATPKPSFFLLVALSAVIAAYGLLQNSAAVIIGAMLVAPLMTPIFAISLGSVRGDRELLVKGLRAEAFGAMLAIGVAFLCGAFGPGAADVHEIVARTSPTLIDLAIAIAAGFAGAYTMTREDLSAALPGVAIAVALLPPLAVVGIELAAREYVLSGRAFLLFLANFLAINLAGSVVFGLTGFAPADHLKDATRVARRFGISIAALVVTAGILLYSLATINAKNRLEQEVRQILQTQAMGVPGAQLDMSDPRNPAIAWDKGVVHVTAVVLTPTAISPENVSATQNILSGRLGREVVLTVRSIVSIDAMAKGYVKQPAAPQQAKADEGPKRATLVDSRRIAEKIITDQLAGLDVPAHLVGGPVVTIESDTLVVEVTYNSARAFTTAQQLAIQRMIAAQTGWQVYLTMERLGASSTGPAPQPHEQAPPGNVPGAPEGIRIDTGKPQPVNTPGSNGAGNG